MYKPSEGFFDLSTRPKTLDKKTFQKLQNIQMWIAHVQQNAEQFRTQQKGQWEKAKDMSAEIQQIIFQHLAHEELFKEG